MRARALRLALPLLICCGTILACDAGASHLLSPQAIAEQVGAHYGDRHATVTRSRSDVTEVDSSPMYLMTIAGHLSKDDVQAATLSFSALATRLYVWDVRAFDGAGRQVWSQEEWGACPGRCRTAPIP